MIDRIRRHIKTSADQAPQIIYLCGLPGSGKSTAASYVARTIGASLIAEFIDPIPEWVVNIRGSASAGDRIKAQLWAVMQHARKNQMLRDERRSANSVVVDRTFVDAVLYASVFGDTTLTLTLDEVDKHDWLPGVYFLLYAQPNEIKRRMITRGDCTEESWDLDWRDFVSQLLAGAQTLSQFSEIHLIDNTSFGIEETAAAIINITRGINKDRTN